MLGIGCRKCADRDACSPPERAGSFIGASRPLPSVPTKVRLLNPLPTLDLGGGDYSSCPIPDLGPTQPVSRHGVGNSVADLPDLRCPSLKKRSLPDGPMLFRSPIGVHFSPATGRPTRRAIS